MRRWRAKFFSYIVSMYSSSLFTAPHSHFLWADVFALITLFYPCNFIHFLLLPSNFLYFHFLLFLSLSLSRSLYPFFSRISLSQPLSHLLLSEPVRLSIFLTIPTESSLCKHSWFVVLAQATQLMSYPCGGGNRAKKLTQLRGSPRGLWGCLSLKLITS